MLDLNRGGKDGGTNTFFSVTNIKLHIFLTQVLIFPDYCALAERRAAVQLSHLQPLSLLALRGWVPLVLRATDNLTVLY